jgi:LacI family transcriptional regulator
MSAIGVYQVAQEMRLRIPEDLSVVGFDNLRESALLNPPLTTVDQFISKTGTLAVDMVVRLVKGEALETNLHKIPTQLVVRDSCLSLRLDDDVATGISRGETLYAPVA